MKQHWAFLAFFMFVGTIMPACKGDKDRAEPTAITVPAQQTEKTRPMMQVTVTSVQADPSVDAHMISTALADAETALLACLPGSGATGALMLTFPIEKDGSVGDIVEGSKTTYKGETTRVCMERVVAGMRFERGAHAEGSAQVTVTLEVAPRR